MMGLRETPFLVRATSSAAQRRLAEHWQLTSLFDGKRATRYFELMTYIQNMLRASLQYDPAPQQLRTVAAAALVVDDEFLSYLLSKGFTDWDKENLDLLARTAASILVTLFCQRCAQVDGHDADA